MIIDGSLNALNINSSFDMKNENGAPVFNVVRNKFMPNKMYITSPGSNIEYLGELVHNKNNDEFLLFEEDAEILHITFTSTLGIPKLEVVSPFGDFSAKFALGKKSLILLDGAKKVLSFSGTYDNYKLDIDDNCNTFYVMAVAYGMNALLHFDKQ